MLLAKAATFFSRAPAFLSLVRFISLSLLAKCHYIGIDYALYYTRVIKRGERRRSGERQRREN